LPVQANDLFLVVGDFFIYADRWRRRGKICNLAIFYFWRALENLLVFFFGGYVGPGRMAAGDNAEEPVIKCLEGWLKRWDAAHAAIAVLVGPVVGIFNVGIFDVGHLDPLRDSLSAFVQGFFGPLFTRQLG